MNPTSLLELLSPAEPLGKAKNLLYRTLKFAGKNKEKTLHSLYIPSKSVLALIPIFFIFFPSFPSNIGLCEFFLKIMLTFTL